MPPPIDPSRRRLLLTLTTALGSAGVVATALPFLASMSPSARARAAGAPVAADLSRLEPAQQMTVEWRGQPVWILRRTPQNLATLTNPALVERLLDPRSEVASQQPPYAANSHRSLKPEYFVAIGICTHLGCSPLYRPEQAPTDLGPAWLGGYFCPCHGSRFDLAGRVFAGVPAPLNLAVPPYRYLSDTVIEIGVDAQRR